MADRSAPAVSWRLIDLPVAVVVHPVAQFPCQGPRTPICIIAVVPSAYTRGFSVFVPVEKIVEADADGGVAALADGALIRVPTVPIVHADLACYTPSPRVAGLPRSTPSGGLYVAAAALAEHPVLRERFYATVCGANDSIIAAQAFQNAHPCRGIAARTCQTFLIEVVPALVVSCAAAPGCASTLGVAGLTGLAHCEARDMTALPSACGSRCTHVLGAGNLIVALGVCAAERLAGSEVRRGIFERRTIRAHRAIWKRSHVRPSIT